MRRNPSVHIAGFVLAMLLVSAASCPAAVEWEILNSLYTGARPVDVAVSADGKSLPEFKYLFEVFPAFRPDMGPAVLGEGGR